MKRIGIDGCRGGWLAVSGAPTPGPLTFELVQDLAPIFAEAEAGRAVIAIDTPIGLADHDGRRCDAAARKLLGDRASCVFTAPSRAALRGGSYTEACDLNFAACGKRLSQQAFGILRSIDQVDRLIQPDLQDRIREVHPEVTFAVLAGHPLREPKSPLQARRCVWRCLPASESSRTWSACGMRSDAGRWERTTFWMPAPPWSPRIALRPESSKGFLKDGRNTVRGGCGWRSSHKN